MDRIIKDDVFLKKVFKRQIKQGIAYHSCVMDYLTISQKVKYTIIFKSDKLTRYLKIR